MPLADAQSATDAAAAMDAAVIQDASADAIAMCPSFGNAAQQCSETCFGDCTGLNSNNSPDPSVHLSNCRFTSGAGISIYCASYGAADPCASCP